jgi:uncharacterized protein (UPF0548 family)
VFRITKPTAAQLDNQIAAAEKLPSHGPPCLPFDGGPDERRLPAGIAHDLSRSLLGKGAGVFVAARKAFERWAPFDIGWVRVANSRATIETGQIIAVEIHTFGLWTLNLSRIIDKVDTPTRFGFVYSTTPMHVETGQEKFIIEFDPATGNAWYELEAVSRPRHPLVQLGFPIARALQHRFARESHRRMRQAVVCCQLLDVTCDTIIT